MKKKVLNSRRNGHAPRLNAENEPGRQDRIPEPAALDASSEAGGQNASCEPTRRNANIEPAERDMTQKPVGQDTGTPPKDSETRAGSESERPDENIEDEPIELDARMVTYVRMVTRLIEGRAVSRDEILQMLNRVMRQHSLGRERRIDYSLRGLKDQPP